VSRKWGNYGRVVWANGNILGKHITCVSENAEEATLHGVESDTLGYISND